MPKLAVGFITYNDFSSKYLTFFVESLFSQSFQDFCVFAIDNSEEKENDNYRFLQGNSRIDLEWAGENLGFAKAYNKLIKKALEKRVEYFLALNPDMILEAEAFEKLVKFMEARGVLGSASPKVLRWDFEKNKKTNQIDTCGIKLGPGLRFFDLGQGEEDNGQYDNDGNVEILGPSGCAAMYRMSALEKVKEGKNYFDETMFMYKEDCDLAYRLFLAGYDSGCDLEAVMYHDRTAFGARGSDWRVAKNRKNKNRKVRTWSFLSQHIIFIKYWRLQNFRNKSAVLFYVFKMFIYVLFFERYLLKEYLKLLKIFKNTRRY